MWTKKQKQTLRELASISIGITLYSLASVQNSYSQAHIGYLFMYAFFIRSTYTIARAIEKKQRRRTWHRPKKEQVEDIVRVQAYFIIGFVLLDLIYETQTGYRLIDNLQTHQHETGKPLYQQWILYAWYLWCFVWCILRFGQPVKRTRTSTYMPLVGCILWYIATTITQPWSYHISGIGLYVYSYMWLYYTYKKTKNTQLVYGLALSYSTIHLIHSWYMLR